MKGLMDDYNKGELSSLLYSGAMTVLTVTGIANQTLRKSRSVCPCGESAREMRRIARELETAAESYRQAAALAFPAPALMAAE